MRFKGNGIIEILRMAGSGAMASATLDNSAAALGGKLNETTLAITGTTILVGSTMRILGTTNYDGMRYIGTVATNSIDIRANFVAETPAGTETITPTLYVPEDIKLIEVKLHLSAAGGTSENFTITQNGDESGDAAYWDTLLYSRDMNTVTDIIWSPEKEIIIPKGDVIDFAYANTNSKNWGLEISFERGT